METKFHSQPELHGLSKLIAALDTLQDRDPSYAMGIIPDVASLFAEFLTTHSGLEYEAVEQASSAFTIALVNAKSTFTAVPIRNEYYGSIQGHGKVIGGMFIEKGKSHLQ